MKDYDITELAFRNGYEACLKDMRRNIGKTITFFDTREELRELTGLPGDNYDQALWDAGFNLDDWDFGFVSDTEWVDGWCLNSNCHYYEEWLLDHMDAHCIGYNHYEYGGKHYYIAYHS